MMEGYPGFSRKIREALDLLKEKNYLNYVYVSKNAKEIRYSGEGSSREGAGNILIGSGGLDGPDPPAGLYNQSVIVTAGHMVHEAIHLEQTSLVDSKIITGNPYEDPLGRLGPEILAYRAQGEFYRTLGISIDVDKYVIESLKYHK